MKNKNLYELKEVINRVNNKGGNKFKLALIINEKMIDERIESLEKLREQTEEFKSFEQKRRELVLEHAELDANGQVVIYTLPEGQGEKADNGFGYPNITKEKQEFEKKMTALQDEYKDVIEAEVKKQADFGETLELSVKPEMVFNKVPFDCIPELEYEEMRILMPFMEN